MTDYYQRPQGQGQGDPYAQRPAQQVSRYVQPAPQAQPRPAKPQETKATPRDPYAQQADGYPQADGGQAATGWEQSAGGTQAADGGQAYAGAYARQADAYGVAPDQADPQPATAPDQKAAPSQYAAGSPAFLTTPQKVAFFFMGLLGSFISVLWVSMMNLGKPYRSDATKLALIGAGVGILLYILLIVGSCSAMAAAIAPYSTGSLSRYSY